MKPEFRHWHRLNVRWGDLDALGHVNNARYFTFLESARLAYLDQAGIWPFGAQLDEGPILARVACNFRLEMNFPSELRVGTRAVSLGRSSFVVEQGIYSHDLEVLFADSQSIIVWFDYNRRESIAIPGEVRKQIVSLEQVSLEGLEKTTRAGDHG